MRDSANALLRIIDDLLDFSKIEAGRLELEETAFSLSGLIDGAIDTFRPQAAGKGSPRLLHRGGLERRAGRRSDAGATDPVQPRQQRVEVHPARRRSRARGIEALGNGATRVTLSVADTGIGLTAEQRARLFQPFAQADLVDHAEAWRHRPWPSIVAPSH